MIFGKTVSELAVEYAKISSSFKILKNWKMLIPNIFAVSPKTTTTKKIIAPYTTINNFLMELMKKDQM